MKQLTPSICRSSKKISLSNRFSGWKMGQKIGALNRFSGRAEEGTKKSVCRTDFQDGRGGTKKTVRRTDFQDEPIFRDFPSNFKLQMDGRSDGGRFPLFCARIFSSNCLAVVSTRAKLSQARSALLLMLLVYCIKSSNPDKLHRHIFFGMTKKILKISKYSN